MQLVLVVSCDMNRTRDVEVECHFVQNVRLNLKWMIEFETRLCPTGDVEGVRLPVHHDVAAGTDLQPNLRVAANIKPARAEQINVAIGQIKQINGPGGSINHNPAGN